MRKAILLLILFGVVIPVSPAQTSSFSTSTLSTALLSIRSKFKNVRNLQTFALNNGDAEVDIVVDGDDRHDHWKLEVWRMVGHKTQRKWRADKDLTSPEFDIIFEPDIYAVEDGFDIEISGCAHHLCADGVNGFLIYSAASGSIRKAKLVTRDLDKAPIGTPRYDVTYSPTSISEREKTELQDVICASNSVSNKRGLPFECKQP